MQSPTKQKHRSAHTHSKTNANTDIDASTHRLSIAVLVHEGHKEVPISHTKNIVDITLRCTTGYHTTTPHVSVKTCHVTPGASHRICISSRHKPHGGFGPCAHGSHRTRARARIHTGTHKHLHTHMQTHAHKRIYTETYLHEASLKRPPKSSKTTQKASQRRPKRIAKSPKKVALAWNI